MIYIAVAHKDSVDRLKWNIYPCQSWSEYDRRQNYWCREQRCMTVPIEAESFAEAGVKLDMWNNGVLA